jgi:hypothetical protein
MAAISLRQLQQINPSGGGRRVPPPPPPQKITGKLGRPFFSETKATIRRRRQGNHRGPNRPRWRGQLGGPCHMVSFEPRGSPRVLPPLQMLLVIKY